MKKQLLMRRITMMIRTTHQDHPSRTADQKNRIEDDEDDLHNQDDVDNDHLKNF